MTLRRLGAGIFATLFVMALASAPVFAASKAPATPRPAPPGQAKKAPVLPPEIFQVNPTKVNPTEQPNIMILGQHLTPQTTVQVGGQTATTIEVPDQTHLLAKLPDNLSHGSYTIEVSNEAGTAVATDPLVVDGASGQLSTLQMAAGAGFIVFLVLVMRLARTPGLR